MEEKSSICRLQRQGDDQVRQLYCPLFMVAVKSEQSNSPPKHILKVGDKVSVFGVSAAGPFLEGHATIVSFDPARNRFNVKFTGENVTRTRFINPDWQERPERSLALLREFWCSSYILNPSAEDFFPERFGTPEE